MNKVKFIRKMTLVVLEESINEFCQEYDVFATQFLEHKSGDFIVALWYREGAVKI